MRHRRRPFIAAAAALACVAAAVPSVAQATRHGGGLALNEVQVIGTHNSYKREITPAEQAKYDELIQTPGDYAKYLAYSHPSITNQLARQDVRGLELDLWPDPQGGLYAHPFVRKALGQGPLPNAEWTKPGTKLIHIADLDYNTSAGCIRFVSCLQQIRAWSDANPRHLPLLIMLEFKQSDARVVAGGGVKAPPWDITALETVESEIRSVFSDRDMITADDIRRRGMTLEQSVLRRGWPSLDEARGKVLFLMDNDPGPIRDAYTANRPNLEGRAIFTNSRPGFSDMAFIKRNEPRNAGLAEIQDLVRRGYLVRTRSDVPLTTILSGDTTQLDAALRSGAQLISTDFQDVGMSARYDSDFVAEVPGGGTWRCNPILVPRGCRPSVLEPSRDW
ncbi:phosphatidylinositol-specific phospholipase C1-like protein [Solirubrobacter sp. CPCC 204708]|uniref:Phosphatidylinositol-specific phospholipase C1-like protein n=1 Tax=Solirubrobacter deserti TaxID=2282478 RepID=A0ABT4RJJ6_9ACTN|nr:phosphatidylinositol-specific phospholipase C1-like protein [Solirubrobacter deserti]MBE2319789.1 phosphatidylinositol-specific phospholipase C1-like protein [Solirubrobacter deserti]MDA0138727.1 phosphatidylinositol-specific phospholipase C1-like protein [Solirubrobacter deserti]